MPNPKGTLTGPQFEILQTLWEDEAIGMTVGEIWDSIRVNRHVSRTTILNLVDRLEKRHWLVREKVDGVYRYKPAVERGQTEQMLANDFVGEYFGGSPSNFILSLLGSKGVSKDEVRKVKKLLDEATGSKSKKAKPKKRRS